MTSQGDQQDSATQNGIEQFTGLPTSKHPPSPSAHIHHLADVLLVNGDCWYRQAAATARSKT